MNIARELYNNPKEIMTAEGAERIGQMAPAGLFMSKHRKGIMGAAKVSAAAVLFELLITKNEPVVAIYTVKSGNSKGIYLEIGEMIKILCGPEEGVVKTLGPATEHQVIMALVLRELYKEDNEELITSFIGYLMDCERPSGKGTKSNLYLFCDSFYFGYAKDAGEIKESSLTESEIEAAFRTGLIGDNLDESVALKEIPKRYLKKSVYDVGQKKKKREASTGNFISDCLAGMYHVSYDWPESMQAYIKDMSFLNTFESTPEFEEIVKKIKFRADRILERMDAGQSADAAIGKDSINIMLLGKPGTGKTTLAYAISAATGIPVGSTVWSKHSDEDEVEGKTKIVDGKPTFVSTYSLDAHTYGGIDINEEINLPDPSVVMGALGQKLEYPYIVKRNGYETVKRHPLNIVIATMNVGTNGSNPLNEALANRFRSVYLLDDPTPETFVNIIQKATGKDKKVCDWAYTAYAKTVKYLKSPEVNEEEICQNLSIRTCIGAIENLDEGQEPTRALINSIVGAVAVADLEVARNLQSEVIETLPVVNL